MSEKQKTPRELNDTSNINSLNKSKVLRVERTDETQMVEKS